MSAGERTRRQRGRLHDGPPGANAHAGDAVTKLAKRVATLHTYPMAELPAIKRHLIQQGVDVIDVGAGDADFPPPPVAVEAVPPALQDPAVSRHPFHLRPPTLPAAAAADLPRRLGVTLDPLQELHPPLRS